MCSSRGWVATLYLVGTTLAASSLGCSGHIAGTGAVGPDDNGRSGGGGTGGAGGGPRAGTEPSGGSMGGVPQGPDALVPGPAGLRRLTDEELRRTLNTLLGTDVGTADTLEPNPWNKYGFDNFGTDLGVSPTLAEQLAALASKVAKSFVPPACPSDETACARDFISSFGRRAFRRPLTDAEVARYSALYTDERKRSDHRGGIAQVVETMVQSPKFLYRSEIGVGTGAQHRLTSHEVAGLLSYMFTGDTPDATLSAAADAGALATAPQIEAQARRLLGSADARPTVRGLITRWAGIARLSDLTKSADVYPEFTPELRDSMARESERFIDTVIWDGDGTLKSLLTAPYSFVDARLAGFYGLPKPSGSDFMKTTLNSNERMGLLTQASVLSAHSKANESFPILRGKFIRVGLLCQALPAPPKTVPKAPQPNTSATTRERFSQHSSDPQCSSCHRLIDPLGFGLENYDGIGHYRSSENGKPVDATGKIEGTVASDGTYTGALELAEKLASSSEAHACLALQAFRWAMGRYETNSEEQVLDNLASRLQKSGTDIRELLVALTTSDAFVLRTYEP